MSKAYDMVEWVFVEQMLQILGFCEVWIELVMNCVKSISYSILLNGKIGNSFNSSRGIRQGDLLSPYLFIMCLKDFPG